MRTKRESSYHEGVNLHTSFSDNAYITSEIYKIRNGTWTTFSCPTPYMLWTLRYKNILTHTKQSTPMTSYTHTFTSPRLWH